jgi:hypothetical protein
MKTLLLSLVAAHFHRSVSNEALRDLFRAIDAAIADSQKKDKFYF